ncbi:GNAT family N-acetyltransferase [Azohydromonas caseinilytica]|uniref:GNAT family N-acetyltransferase n=1 Tax=Azohydromonas caseinilytica TaxID=2728836 RepID=A0A848FAT5_9BURK|nr:GNAT family N-acetyltransferase [Azohydromonas caseinilytica]NML15549.1 GNAT family N-acetyltransferase [Azohydromonas caseinilytica]
MDLAITPATAAEADTVAALMLALTEEICARLGVRHFDLDRDQSAALCADWISRGEYVALLARMDGRPVGFVGMSEGRALYAGGAVGTMQEFYVSPECRSAGVGRALIEAVKTHARERGWRRIEVCTPPLPEFQRSLDFYARNGFEVTGGRKMKVVVD